MTRAEDLVKQASAAGLEPKANFFITPGSEQIRATLARDSTLDTFSSAGATVLANACGPCIGQWRRTDGVSRGDSNAILTSYNRMYLNLPFDLLTFSRFAAQAGSRQGPRAIARLRLYPSCGLEPSVS